MLHPTLQVSQESIAEFCRTHNIRWLAVFGSAVRDDFTPESDVDILVEFEEGKSPGISYFMLDQDISPLFAGRRIDLATRDSVNRWIRAKVLREAEVLYDAA